MFLYATADLVAVAPVPSTTESALSTLSSRTTVAFLFTKATISTATARVAAAAAAVVVAAVAV